MQEAQHIYGGLSGAKLAPDSFDFGEGVVIRRTYAHLMSPTLMAFSPPGPSGIHPAPWSAAKGGFSFDIEVEIQAPLQTSLGEKFSAQDTIWWIAALLRLVRMPYLSVPVLSNQPFHSVPNSTENPTLQPFEIDKRIFQPGEPSNQLLQDDVLSWIKEKWRPAGQLLNSNPKFYTAFKAFDSATVRGRASSSLLAMWGGLEQLFAPSTGELRFRVAALLASYLEPQGTARLNLYKKILKLYNERSIAAHTAQEIENEPLVQTYVLMRNVLVKMVDENKVPTQSELEAQLFGCSDGE